MAEELFKNLGINLDPGTYYCPLLNISQCEVMDNSENVILMVYNPLPRTSDFVIRVPSSLVDPVAILDENGQEVEAESVLLKPEILAVPGRDSIADMEVVFKAESVPPLGMNHSRLCQDKH